MELICRSDAPVVSETARHYLQHSRPRSPHLHLWREGGAHRLLVSNGSQLFDLPDGVAPRIEQAVAEGRELSLLAELGVNTQPLIDDSLPEVGLHALSLAVAQKCNLGCSYCYAQQGDFGGSARNMPLENALRAVDLLIEQTPQAGRFNLAFMGGEPLVNRQVLRAATLHAAERAEARGLKPLFSITTNGTLLTEADGEFFEQHGFAVTISLDGVGEQHDQLRPYKGGRGSFERIMRNVRPLLAMQRSMQVSARVTVTPRNLSLQPMLDAFLAEGFHSVGFSPMLNAPSGQDEMAREDLEVLLSEMIRCGEAFERAAMAGERYAFSNMANALREIDKGTHRPYPCGAGAGYMGVSAEGDLYACHRFVNDEAGRLGNLGQGVDAAARGDWLRQRHVHQQSPCDRCWARYQCGGGCHHEVMQRPRAACDYVRGWLHYCMDVHARLSRRPHPGPLECLDA